LNKLRVLYISHLHPPKYQPLESVGGMQNVSMQLVDALKKNEQVELETIIQRAPWKGIGFATTGFLFRLLFLIPKAIREFNPDVILFSSMVTAGVIPFLGNRIKVPMVTINHGQDVTLPFWIYQKYLPTVFKKLSGVISVSKATREACIERGMDPEKGVVLPNGLDRRKARNLPDKLKAKAKLKEIFGINFNSEKYLLLTVGRQVKRKGHAWFIREVLPLLTHPVNYLVVGDGPEFENIKHETKLSEFKESIILAGRQPEEVLNLAYAGADLFVMPNIPVDGDMEGFGIVLLEANQNGLPAVASDLEGIRDVIQQGVNGYRVSHSKPKIFAQKVDEVLENELEKLSDSSKKYVLNQFSWNTVVNQYVNFLKKVSLKGE
jgi:phosphatidyl-myo-inositol dimannoside synthase